MSDYLANFVHEDDSSDKKTRKVGISFIDNAPRRAPRPVATTTGPPPVVDADSTKPQYNKNAKFYKKDDGIHVIFKYRNNPEEEIIIQPLKKSNMTFLNKSVIFYGPSGSGKTFVIYNYMYIMSDLFPVVFVFAPTNDEKHDFDKHVPWPLIFEEFGITDIRDVYWRQKAATNDYNKANNLKILHKLFMRVANGKAKQHYRKLLSMREKFLEQADRTCKDTSIRKAKMEEIEELFKFKMIRFYKHIISPYSKRLMNQNLSQEEKTALVNINLNPRTLVIFDDATTEVLGLIKEGKKKVKGEATKDGEVIKNFFFKGRWANITHWYAMHDDTGLDSDIRKNAFYSVFCNKQVALAFFTRKANSFTLVEQKRAEAIINAVFDKKTAPKWAKLVYARLENKFYYLVADEVPEDFKMCSEAVWKYCDRIAKKESDMDSDNPFVKKFQQNINF
jgi:hypothetical protein